MSEIESLKLENQKLRNYILLEVSEIEFKNRVDEIKQNFQNSADLERLIVPILDRIEKIENYEKLDITDLASKLFVRYIATGTLWKMNDMFQLSIELYDTKDKKVVWSDRWQENWDNLSKIKGSLSDGLLKALDTKPKVEQKVETTNPEAYEFYLKAKHKYAKRENTDDTEITRGLLEKAISLDGNLIVARVWYGRTYYSIGDYENAMTIYKESLKLAEGINDEHGISLSLIGIGNIHNSIGEYNTALDYYERSLIIKEKIGDKIGKAWALINIGSVYTDKGDLGTTLDYYERSLAIFEELGDKRGMGASLGSFGIVHSHKGDIGKALDYYERSLEIKEELGDKQGMGSVLNNIGLECLIKGDYENALDYYDRSLAIAEELGDKRGMGRSLLSIGHMHWNKGDDEKALEYLEKSLAIQKEIGLKNFELETTTYLYFAHKHLGKEYNVTEIHALIKEQEYIEYYVNFTLFKLLDEPSYLKTAHNQVQEKASAMGEELKAKFLSYPIPKAIVEEYNKVFN